MSLKTQSHAEELKKQKSSDLEMGLFCCMNAYEVEESVLVT